MDSVLQNEIAKSTQDDEDEYEEDDEDVEYDEDEEDDGYDDEPTETYAEYDTAEVNEAESTQEADPNVDIDVSVMNSDMVYATIYQLISEPNEYIGKLIKIKGEPYSSYYEPTDMTYHYVLIQDAAACCAQGMEFVMANGLAYPDEAEENEEEVTIIGTFTTYEEEGNLYCTLMDSIVE